MLWEDLKYMNNRKTTKSNKKNVQKLNSIKQARSIKFASQRRKRSACYHREGPLSNGKFADLPQAYTYIYIKHTQSRYPSRKHRPTLHFRRWVPFVFTPPNRAAPAQSAPTLSWLLGSCFVLISELAQFHRRPSPLSLRGGRPRVEGRGRRGGRAGPGTGQGGRFQGSVGGGRDGGRPRIYRAYPATHAISTDNRATHYGSAARFASSFSEKARGPNERFFFSKYNMM